MTIRAFRTCKERVMKKILIIDDEKYFYEELKMSKYSKYFDIEFVDRYEDVPGLKTKPDLILLDFVLHTNNSYDLKIKEALNNMWPEAIVIYVSSFFKDELEELGESDLFINKSQFSYRSLVKLCKWGEDLPF